MESYIKRLETLEALCNGFEGVESSYAVQAGREVRILVQPDKVSDDEVILLARNVAKKIENEAGLPRSDQGQRHPREPSNRVREVKIHNCIQQQADRQNWRPACFLYMRQGRACPARRLPARGC